MFRATRKDFKDIDFDFDAKVMAFKSDSDDVRRAVLRALVHGSDARSPFRHCPRDLRSARRWRDLARRRRNERQEGQILVMIDLWDWCIYFVQNSVCSSWRLHLRLVDAGGAAELLRQWGIL